MVIPWEDLCTMLPLSIHNFSYILTPVIMDLISARDCWFASSAWNSFPQLPAQDSNSYVHCILSQMKHQQHCSLWWPVVVCDSLKCFWSVWILLLSQVASYCSTLHVSCNTYVDCILRCWANWVGYSVTEPNDFLPVITTVWGTRSKFYSR